MMEACKETTRAEDYHRAGLEVARMHHGLSLDKLCMRYEGSDLLVAREEERIANREDAETQALIALCAGAAVYHLKGESWYGSVHSNERFGRDVSVALALLDTQIQDSNQAILKVFEIVKRARQFVGTDTVWAQVEAVASGSHEVVDGGVDDVELRPIDDGVGEAAE